MELGYVGLGAMGGALARRLMLSHKLRVLDLRPEAVAAFAENGAIPAQDGASLARESDILLLCLPRSADVREAIFGAGGSSKDCRLARLSLIRRRAILTTQEPWPRNWRSRELR